MYWNLPISFSDATSSLLSLSRLAFFRKLDTWYLCMNATNWIWNIRLAASDSSVSNTLCSNSFLIVVLLTTWLRGIARCLVMARCKSWQWGGGSGSHDASSWRGVNSQQSMRRWVVIFTYKNPYITSNSFLSQARFRKILSKICLPAQKSCTKSCTKIMWQNGSKGLRALGVPPEELSVSAPSTAVSSHKDTTP